MAVKELLQKFEKQAPEIVFEWNDAETGAKGWVVINSLRGGAAGGGTRMRKGLDKYEVISLAKTMEIKFTYSGPAIGGAKSGIDFDPSDPRKQQVLQRWYQAVLPLLKNYYGTGGDLNVDEIHEVIPITEEFGLWHPQEGIVNGHFKPREIEKIQRIGQLRTGVSKVIEDINYSPDVSKRYVVADMITGYGVAESVRCYYTHYKENLKNKRVIVQGWGNVAAAAAFYLAKEGAKIVGIIDKVGGVMKPEGFSFEEIKALFINKKGNTLSASVLTPFSEMDEKIWSLGAEVFIPAAASRIVKQDQIEKLLKNGLEVVASGANVPFADTEIFLGPIAEYVDSRVSVLPDFIANCGMARVFAYLMQSNVELSDNAIFQDVSQTIHQSLQKVFAQNSSRKKITETALELSLKQLVK